MSIHVLPPEVVDQIAAGEVVERPSHLVKELVENSLDAGATEVEIDFSRGGRFVRVSDNGSGILKEEFPLVFSRHATSKINLAQDLWALNSFGFRGEALASIAAVSRVTLFSSKGDAAYQVKCEFGRLGSVDPTSRSQGTTIVIEDLFENIPARLKFLKSDASEHAAIKLTLKALALSHSKVSFRILQDGSLLYYFPKDQSPKERAESVLEISPLYEGRASRGDVHCTAYFADPNKTAKTSRQIWLFAQSRWIQDRSLQAAVMEAYRNLLMHGEFPICVAFVSTIPENIDVNIHPTKSQVKFLEAQDAFRAVQGALRESLEKAPWIPKMASSSYIVNSDGLQSSSFVQGEDSRKDLNDKLPLENLSFSGQEFSQAQFRKKEFTQIQDGISYAYLKQIGRTEIGNSLDVQSEKHGARGYWSSLEVLGQAGLTYLICQSTTGVVFVDQHAAHERVAFERLMSAWKGGRIEVQQFLFPLTIDLSEEKVEGLIKMVDSLKRLGIEIEQMGPSSVGVKAAPLLLKDRILSEEIERLAIDLVERGDSFNMEKAVGDVCARLACHSVVRAGQALSVQEMRQLLHEMDEFPLSSFCPHGRPVSVDYPFLKLERDFGRIV